MSPFRVRATRYVSRSTETAAASSEGGSCPVELTQLSNAVSRGASRQGRDPVRSAPLDIDLVSRDRTLGATLFRFLRSSTWRTAIADGGAMPDTIRLVDYYYTTTPDKVGEGARL